jgi:predicted phosphodiesterase
MVIFLTLKKLINLTSRIASLADKIPVFLVGGNHGRELDFIARKIGVTVIDNHAFTVADKKFLCLHGDEFDMFIKRLPITTHVFTQLFYLIQKLDGEKQYGAMVIKRLSKKILGISKRQQRLALKRGADQKANVVICSHTHIPHIGEQDGIQFINSGSFCDSKSTYVTIDNEGLVNLREI